MPYKDEQKRKEYKRKWNKNYYLAHRQQEISRKNNRRNELKEWFDDYKKTLRCKKCGENNSCCLEFHHLNRTEKLFGVSELIQRRICSKKKILAEIEKCIVLCANCHRKLHSKRET